MRRDGTKWIVVSSATLGALLAALVPALLRSEPSTAAWVFGVGFGLAQSLVGLHLYRRALARPESSLLLGLGSGVVRLLFLLVALAIAIRAGLPAEPAAWSLLTMYLSMMAAEILVVARTTHLLPSRAA